MNEEINRLWDIFSAEEENTGDDFFVGAGSGKLVKSHSSPESFSDQLILASDEIEIPIRNDLSRFETEKIEVVGDDVFETLFLNGKKKAYNFVGYLDIKSVPMGEGIYNERDLLLGESDLQLIKELKFLTKDYFAIHNLSILYAYLEMGIHEVMFKQHDECSMCIAYDGFIVNTRQAINVVCSGNGITHKYCDCEFFPVVYRENSYGALDNKLNTDVSLDGKELVNVPIEMESELIKHIEKIPNTIIEFLNIQTYMRMNNVENSVGVVVLEDEEGILFVHNSYINTKGPIDFLKAFLMEEKYSEKIDPKRLKNKEVLYSSGKKVVELDGKYWDYETGEEVKEI